MVSLSFLVLEHKTSVLKLLGEYKDVFAWTYPETPKLASNLEPTQYQIRNRDSQTGYKEI